MKNIQKMWIQRNSIMNRILMNNNIIVEIGNATVDDNKIVLKDGENYYLEFVNCTDISIEIVANDASLNIISLGNNFNSKIIYNITGYLKVYSFYNNNSVVENILVNLDKEGARVDYYFSSICKVNEKYNIDIFHNAKKTISNVYNKCISIDSGNINFIINSYVYKDNIKCKLNQDTRIVTMGDNNAMVKPNMYIDLDDVEAFHSSNIGQFDNSLIFYLMSRGISYSDSIKLLIKGFLLSNMDNNIIKRKIVLDIINRYWG